MERRKNVMAQRAEAKKFQRYGIRKFKQGAASVMIASGLFFLSGGGTVSAEEVTPATSSTVTETATAKDSSDAKTESKEEAKASAAATESSSASTSSVTDSASTTSTVDKTDLKKAIQDLEEEVATVKHSDSIDKTLEKVQDSLDKAKALVDSQSASQEEVDKAVKSLKDYLYVVKSMPKADAEEKEVTLGANSIMNTGSNDPRNGQPMTVGSQLLAASDYISTPNGNGGFTTTATDNSVATSTGKDVYTFNADGTAGTNVVINSYSGDLSKLVIEVGSNQRTGTEINPANAQTSDNANNTGHNNKGRVDYPLTDEEAKKLAAEAPLWKGKLRIDGSTISTSNNTVFQANGGYEYLATHIYRLVYEQGTDRVYIPKFKERFSVSTDAATAGWEITSVNPSNLPTGLIYNADTDTIEGTPISNRIPDGVYDMRTTVVATNKITNATVSVTFSSMRAGWIGMQDTTPPVIETDGTAHKGTVGDALAGVDILYKDNSGSRLTKLSNKPRTYVLADGTEVSINVSYGNVGASGVAGNMSSSGSKANTDIPGLEYSTNAKTSSAAADGAVTGQAVISGTPTTAGVYYVTVYAKDFNATSRATDYSWQYDGQETRAGLTFIIAPKVTVKNVATYATAIPVEISAGATYAEVVMPDGSKTILEANTDGKWIVATGTTNTAVKVGDEVGSVGSQFNLAVSSEATATAGVSNISVYAKTENVMANLMRTKVLLNSATTGKQYEATLNPTTGRYELEAADAEVRTELADGNYQITKREVAVRAQTDGSIKFDLYEYTRTYNASNVVTAVNDVTLTETDYAKADTANSTTGNGMYITVNYDKNTNKWTASDGSTVTATKTTDDTWEVKTSSGYTGTVKGVMADNNNKASIINTKPTASSASYESVLGAEVDLVKADLAKVTIVDAEDDALKAKEPNTTHITKITKVTVTSPSGVSKTFTDVADAHNYVATSYSLDELGKYTVTIDVEDSNHENGGNAVGATADIDTTNAVTAQGDSTTSTTYYITVKTATPTATPATSKDIVGESQSGTVAFTAGKTSINGTETEVPLPTNKAYYLVDSSGNAVTTLPAYAKNADGSQGSQVGTYTIDTTTGAVTYTPFTPSTETKLDKTYVGDVLPAKVALADADKNNKLVVGEDGTVVTAEYTPTIVPVTPTATASTTIGPKGKAQASSIVLATDGDTDNGTTVNFIKGSADVDGTTKTVDLDESTLTLLDAEGNATKSVTVAGGTYTLDGTTITFTPNADFTGTADPVTVQVKDKNGTAATTTYTPTVVDAQISVPSTEAVQGKTQTSETPSLTTEGGKVNVKSYSLVDPTSGDSVTTVTVKGEGKYTIDSTTGVVTFVPEAGYTGTTTGVTIKATTDVDGLTPTTTYKPVVNPITLTGTPATTTDIQGATQKSENATTPVAFTPSDDSAKITGYKLIDPATKTATSDPVVIAGVGTYTVDATSGQVTFVPEKGYTGETPTSVTVQATATVTNADGETAEITGTTTYTPVVKPVTPTATASKTIGPKNTPQTSSVVLTTDGDSDDSTTVNFIKGSTDINGTEKSVDLDASTLTLLDAEGKETKSVKVEGGTYTLDGTTITFTPDTDYVGTAPAVTVQVKDANGTPVTTTYTPTVVDASITVESSEDVQGKTQKSSTPVFTPTGGTVNVKSYSLVDPETGNSVETVTVKGEGKYTIDPTTGVVTFVPEAGYTGTTTGVTIKATTDVDGLTPTTTYKPVVNPITLTGTPATTTDIQGATQKSENATTPLAFTPSDASAKITGYKLIDAATGTATSDPVVIAGVGTYTVDATSGQVTFVPEKGYTGATPTSVTVQATATVTNETGDTAEITGTTTYTPVVKPVTPTATASKTIGPKNTPQTSSVVLTTDGDSDDSTTVNFIKGSTDINGTEKSVDLDASTLTLLDASGNPTNTVKVAGGTYTLDGTTITFTPDTDFTGTAPAVTVQVKDVNGTPVTTTYTPTVVDASITVESSEDVQGKTQKSSTPVFTPTGGTVNVKSYSLVDPETGKSVTTVTVPNEGTYTIDPTTGVVTFVPEAGYTGTTTGVTIQASTDVPGLTPTAVYKPVVKPITMTGTPAETTDKQGVTQRSSDSVNKMVFTPSDESAKISRYDLIDPATGKATTSLTVPGQGTYTIDPVTGVVTFVPEEDYTGTATSVTVQATAVVTNEKGETAEITATATYTPTVTPIYTDFVDQNGKPIPGTTTEKGKKDKGDFPGYRYVKTTVDENGNITHHYEQVKTSFVDKDGKEIPGYPTVDGEQPKENIPGYRFVETRKLPNGDTEHVYEQVKTSFVDKNGKEIPGYPTVDGEQPKENIPGYRFVETRKLPNGDIEHVYEKVSSVTTSYVDQDGNPIPGYPTVDGEQPKADIPGYEFVETIVDEDGNTVHVYKKLSGQGALPNTGSENSVGILGAALASLAAGFGLAKARKRKED